MLRRTLAVALSLALVAALSACGNKQNKTLKAETEGIYLDIGELKYQVQISRQLTERDPEDRDYLTGLPAGQQRLGKGEEWFAVFIRVFNMTKSPHPAAQQFSIRDTTGKVFTPVAVDTNINRTAYRPLEVGSGDQIPVPGSLARENLTQGGLILFKVPSSSYANRPLELRIVPPEGGQEATVDLDV
jgi:hypothetical protein